MVLLVNGTCQGDSRIITTAPLDVGKQHVLSEEYHSTQMNHRADDKVPGRRQVFWTRRGGQADGPFRVRCDYFLTMDVLHPTAGAARVARGLAEAPQKGEHLDRESKSDTDQECITLAARKQTMGVENPTDVAESLYRFVHRTSKMNREWGGPVTSAADCLRAGGGDCAARVGCWWLYCGNRGIPARLVAGVTLTRVSEQRAHTWVEAWVRERWLPMCPSCTTSARCQPTT